MARSGTSGGGSDLRAVLSVAVEDEARAIGRLETLLSQSAQSFDEQTMQTMFRLLDNADELRSRMATASSEADFQQAERELRVLSDEAEKFTRKLERSEEGTLAMQGGFRALQDQIGQATKDVDNYYDKVAKEEARMDDIREEAYEENRKRTAQQGEAEKDQIERREAAMRDYFQTVEAGAERVYQTRLEMARGMGFGAGGPGLMAQENIQKRVRAVQQLRSGVRGVGFEAAKTGGKFRSTMLNQELLRTLQDAQFGMLGMANNIQQMAENLARADRPMDRLMAGMKSLIMGPFAIPALITVITLLVQNWDKVVDVAGWVSDAFSGVSSEARGLQNSLDDVTSIDMTSWAEEVSLQTLRDEISKTREEYEKFGSFWAKQSTSQWISDFGRAMGADLLTEGGRARVSGFFLGSDGTGEMGDVLSNRLQKVAQDARESLDARGENFGQIQDLEDEKSEGVSDDREKEINQRIEELEAMDELAAKRQEIQQVAEELGGEMIELNPFGGVSATYEGPDEDRREQAEALEEYYNQQLRESQRNLNEAQQPAETGEDTGESVVARRWGDREAAIEAMKDGLEKRQAEIDLEFDKRRYELIQEREDAAETYDAAEDGSEAKASAARAMSSIDREMPRLPSLRTKANEEASKKIIQEDVDWIAELNEERANEIEDQQNRNAERLSVAMQSLQNKTRRQLESGDVSFGLDMAKMDLRQQAERGGLFNMGNSFDQQMERIRAERDAQLRGLTTEQIGLTSEKVKLETEIERGENDPTMYSDSEMQNMRRRHGQVEHMLAQHAERKKRINAEAEREMTQAQRTQMQTRIQYMQQGMQQVGQVFGSIAQMQDQQSREAFERRKKMLYGQAVMDALSAGIGIWRTWFGPDAKGDPLFRGAMAAAQSATVVAGLIAKAKKISGMSMEGGGGGGGGTGSFTQSTRGEQSKRADRLARQRGEDRSRDRGDRQKRNLTDEDVEELSGAINDKKVTIDRRTSAGVVDQGNGYNENRRI